MTHQFTSTNYELFLLAMAVLGKTTSVSVSGRFPPRNQGTEGKEENGNRNSGILTDVLNIAMEGCRGIREKLSIELKR